MLRTYKYRLYPNKEQQDIIDEQIDICRALYNKMLKQRIDIYKRKWVSLSKYTQYNQLPLLKQNKEKFTKVHSQVLQKVLDRLEKSFKWFFRRLKQWEKPWFPRFRWKNRFNTLEYPQSWFSLIQSKDWKKKIKLKLSKIWEISMRKHRDIPWKIKTLSLTKSPTWRYYACIVIDIEKQEESERIRKRWNFKWTTTSTWIDVWINSYISLSNWEQVDNPKILRKKMKKLKRTQRALSRKKKWSHNRKKQINRVSKQHESVWNSRSDYLHKLSRELIDKYWLIVLEKLNIRWMVKNHHLALSISDASWWRFVELLHYKAESAGSEVVLVDPKYTSQKCSSCWEIVKKSLSVRTHICSNCWYVDDRDVNAAKNILKKWLEQLEKTIKNTAGIAEINACEEKGLPTRWSRKLRL